MGPKKRDPLPTKFTCLFCNHEEAVSVSLNKKAGVGHLSCAVCGQTFQCAINYLSAAVDVYSEWVDAADMVAKDDEDKRMAPDRSRSQIDRSQEAAAGELSGEDDNE